MGPRFSPYFPIKVALKRGGKKKCLRSNRSLTEPLLHAHHCAKDVGARKWKTLTLPLWNLQCRLGDKRVNTGTAERRSLISSSRLSTTSPILTSLSWLPPATRGYLKLPGWCLSSLGKFLDSRNLTQQFLPGKSHSSGSSALSNEAFPV